MRRTILAAAAAAALAATAAGCGGSAPATASAGAASPGTSSTPPAASGAAGSPLAGFGASVDAWDATRSPDQDFDPGTAYGADPALPPIDGHAGARYVAVSASGGYVVGYQVNYPAHTAIGSVLADILRREFPPDATLLWKRTVPGCYQAEVKSAKLAAALNTEGLGDGTGLVFLEARTLASAGAGAFNTKDVSYATLGFQSVASAGQAPGC